PVYIPAALRKAGVLCVDAHPINQRRFAAFFGQHSVDCITLDSPAAALALLQTRPQPPGLVLVDQANLEAAAGSELLQRLVNDTSPLLLLSAPGQSASGLVLSERKLNTL